MNDERFFLRRRARFVVACALLIVSAGGCRSSRSSVEETSSELRVSVSDSDVTEAVGVSAAAGEARSDSSEIRTDARGVVSIARDSAGRIVGIRAERVAEIKSAVRVLDTRSRWFYGLNATRSSEAAASVVTVGEEKKEAAAETQVRVPLMVRLLWIVVAVVIVFYVGDFIFRRWNGRWRR